MKKTLILILCLLFYSHIYAQKITKIYGCNASIIYKSKDDFKTPYLQYYSAMLMTGLESKTMKANPNRYEKVSNNPSQIVMLNNFIFGKTKQLESFENRLVRLNKHLANNKNKPIQIDVVSGMLYRIEPLEALPINLKQK